MKKWLALAALAGIAAPLAGQTDDNCFLENAEPKTMESPAYTLYEKPAAEPTIFVSVDVSQTVARVPKYIFGTNANIYTGSYNREPRLVEYLKLLDPHIIRYPGGLHSNEYFWNTTPNSMPSDLPKKLVNRDGSTYDPYWVPGKGSWTFALDDFYDLLDKTGCEGLITVNYSYARYGTGPAPVSTAAKLAADWVRYDNGRTRFWEIGNENCSWGSGYRIDLKLNQDGQPEVITPRLYGEHVRVFADSMRKAAAEIGHTIYIGSQNDAGVLEGAGNAPDWMVDHAYFTPYNHDTPAATILNLVADEARQYADKTLAECAKWKTGLKPVTMTEWNIFAQGSGQPPSYVNGMHGVMVLGELIKNGYGMSNRWNIANGSGSSTGPGDDMGMFSTGDNAVESARKWNPRAPFYYLYYFQKFFGDRMVASSVSGSKDFVAYASAFGSGHIGAVVVNKGTAAGTVRLVTDHFTPGVRFYVYSLCGGNDNGEFSLQVFVNEIGPAITVGGPIDDLEDIEANGYLCENDMKFASPGRSVQYILIEGAAPVKDAPGAEAAGGPPARVSVYPSPARGRFQIAVSPGTVDRLDVVNVRGQIVFTKSVGPAETFVAVPAGLPSGMYFIKAAGPSKTAVTKFTIVR